MDYGSSDTSTTSLSTNQFPISEVYVANTGLKALGGGPKQTDGSNKDYAPALMYIQDGSDVAQGTTTDTAVTGDNPGTQAAKLRGLAKILADIWDSVNHRIKVDGSGVTQTVIGSVNVSNFPGTQPVSGTVTTNAGTGNMGSNLTQVAGNNVAVGNNAVPVLNSAATGYVAAWGSNPAALTSATDYSFKWGAGGTTQVNHILLQNNTASSLNWDLDATATGGSPTLASGQTLFLDVQTSTLHLFQAGTPNVNGTASGNIAVRGWL